MAITDNVRMTIKVCRLYYEENMSQKEISAQLGISRPQVSRMLAHARANNIVSIKINNPFVDEARLEQLLMERFHLKDVLVVNTNGASEKGRLEEFGRLAAGYLGACISENNRVGVMSGKTISSVAWSIKRLEHRGLEFVPLVGGIGSAGVNYHANAIAQRFADCSSGSCYVLNAPVIVNSEESRNMLIKEPGIAKVLKKGEFCDVAIVGIGQIDISSTTAQAGAMNLNDIKMLKEAGAVASVCTSYINDSGELVHTELNRRSIGQTLEQLKKCKTIALAIGNKKVQSIKAALLCGYIDVFITDLETARAIIDEA
jgi:deoxyribonucleoside regulator